MMKAVAALSCVLVAVTPVLAEPPDKAISLKPDQPMRTGTVVRELIHVSVEGGKTRIEAKSGPVEYSTRWMHRYNLVRRVQGNAAEEVDVRDHVCERGNFPVGPLPPPAESFGLLSSKSMRARRRPTGWDYSLKDGKANAGEQSCLLDLGFASSVLEIIPVALGTKPHKVGDTWAADIPNPRAKVSGMPTFKDVETTLGSVEERADGSYAHLFIHGSFTMERPLGYKASLEVTFNILLTRRLSDMLDVEAKITGTFKSQYEASFVAAENGSAERAMFTQDFPYTLTRTLKLEPK